MRFNRSGRILCAVSNDGSANAWLYPTERVTRSPSPETEVTDQTELGAGETARDADERKSRATSPRDEPAEESSQTQDGTTATADGLQDGGDGEAQAASAIQEDIDMGEAGNNAIVPEASQTETTGEPPAQTEPSNGDVEMAVDATPKPSQATPPTASQGPSRQNSPPPSVKRNPINRPKARPLKCVRHSICHSASLLSLSFDPAGK